ncbi:PAN domain-containing protein At5g03700 [Camellia sinensis]|uniref:PAN domain-containing protein At5g03700 n=1 Tax=Camellia sinensis TaxID=4442 RepID=UPI001036BB9E|nr:PAN domain-containing protein At5g03700 [Camellia sinensis]
MERHAVQPINSVTRFGLTQLLYTITTILFILFSTAAAATQELLRGFTSTPDPSVSSFQALLSDSTGNYSLGFIRVKQTQLALSVIHVPSSEQLWVANMTRLPKWSGPTRLFFNGSLVISDSHSGVFWSTQTDGDRVWISNTSNLQIEKLDQSHSILWQSFQFPSDTLVENQNFTSAMSLVSSNGLYYMMLGSDFVGLYARFNPGSDSNQIYLKHKALEAKADVIEGQGPIYMVLSSDGFLGMYQNGLVPVDVQSFSTFQQRGSGIRRVRIEPDGNLKGYFWTGSSWVLDYQAISDPCELPSSCGSYGLCQPGKGCSCINNRTDHSSGGCDPQENNSGDFCGTNGDDKYWVLRRNGVELPFKELMGYEKMGSELQCERACEVNCTCWGVVYSNSSGFCYMIDYPIQSLVGIGDETKVGYFKVREGVGKKDRVVGYGVGIGVLCGAVLVFGMVVGFGIFRVWKRKRGVKGYVEEDGEVGVGPYKNLGSASFRSIELCEK